MTFISFLIRFLMPWLTFPGDISRVTIDSLNVSFLSDIINNMVILLSLRR